MTHRITATAEQRRSFFLLLFMGLFVIFTSCHQGVRVGSEQTEITIEKQWPAILPTAKKLHLELDGKQLHDVRLQMEQPYRLMSDQVIDEGYGYSVLYTAYYDQRGCWLEIDTIRHEIRVNPRHTMVLNYNYHEARKSNQPLQIRLMSADKTIGQLVLRDTTSGSLVLYRWR